jgi:hypothetical protein
MHKEKNAVKKKSLNLFDAHPTFVRVNLANTSTKDRHILVMKGINEIDPLGTKSPSLICSPFPRGSGKQANYRPAWASTA